MDVRKWAFERPKTISKCDFRLGLHSVQTPNPSCHLPRCHISASPDQRERQRQRAMEEAEVLELYEIHYLDLMLLSSTTSSSLLEETDRLKLISRAVMEALGPEGPGLLSISGVPEAFTLRRDLLPLARRLALLNPDDCKRILKVIFRFIPSFIYLFCMCVSKGKFQYIMSTLPSK